ncbi:MAG TPA: SMP-30/gluconolactonase/LRE family protein [Steroidobacteraceae bacterium]|nr:SMP-30/gluconolactonase/LRE family protein [Steroidobacteraceae bacterium]
MELTVVAEGLQFPEGPVALADGSVLVVEIRRGTLTRVTPDGAQRVVAHLGGGPNGAAIGPDGAVYVCNNGAAWTWQEGEAHLPNGPPAQYRGGSIQRVDLATGRFTTLYDGCDGKPLNSPNDLVFDAQGGFWFTCLGQTDGEVRRMGALYHARPDGSRIVRWRSDLFSPNGVGLSPDERTVYMADCAVGRLYAFDLTAPGVMAPPAGDTTAPGRVVCTLPGYQWLDSLAVEADGRICVGTLWNGGITVFEPGGAYEYFPVPDPVTTNICFGGPDMRDAWITASSTGRLYRCRWPRPGLKLPFNA